MKYTLFKMKIAFFATFCSLVLFSQNNFKLPKTTVFYMEINGKQLNNKVDWARFNPIIQEVSKKKDKENTWNDYSKTGIKYDDKQYHYYTLTDSLSSYNSHFILDDEKKFLDFIHSIKEEGLEITKKKNYSYVSLSNNTFVAWQGNHAVLKVIHYTEPDLWNIDESVVVDSVAVADSTIVTPNYDEDAYEAEAEEVKPFDYKEEIKSLEEDLKYYKQSIKDTQATIAEIKKSIQYLKKHHKYPDVKPDADSTEDLSENQDEYYNDEIETDEEFEKRMDSLTVENFKMVQKFSEQDFDEIFSSNFQIEVPAVQTKFRDEKADVFAVTNLGQTIMNNDAYRKMQTIGGFQNYFAKMYNTDSSYNLYFEKDKVKLVNNYQNRSPEMQKSISDIYSGKTNNKLSKLLSDKNIGYFAMNIDGYKGFDATYDMIKNIGSNEEYQNEISLLVETMKIVLDEKAISEIMPGNAIFILNDLTSKKVEYTDFEFDEEFNEIEVKKTKDVPVPNFTFAFITENEGYWSRIFNMLATNKKTAKHFVKNGNLYQYKDEENNEIEKLFFEIKDGVVYIATSAENIGEKKQSSATKKWAKEASKHTFSGRFSSVELIDGLKMEFTSKRDTDLYNFLRNNLGEINYKTDVKNESIQTEMNYEISNSSDNSLMYFFDLFDGIYKITNPQEEPKKM